MVHEVSCQAVHELSSQAAHKLSSQAIHMLSGHPALNPISDKCRLTWYVVALNTARIFEFFVECLCSGLWSSCFRVFPPPLILYFSSFHCFISLTGAWNGGSWLGCRDLPAMGAVFYLGAGWPWWKPLRIPGSHLPLKQGSWLIDLSSFFGLSQCIPCSPSWRFCTTLITSCKSPILLQLVIYLILG